MVWAFPNVGLSRYDALSCGSGKLMRRRLKLTSSGFACVQRHGGERRWSRGRD